MGRYWIYIFWNASQHYTLSIISRCNKSKTLDETKAQITEVSKILVVYPAEQKLSALFLDMQENMEKTKKETL